MRSEQQRRKKTLNAFKILLKCVSLEKDYTRRTGRHLFKKTPNRKGNWTILKKVPQLLSIYYVEPGGWWWWPKARNNYQPFKKFQKISSFLANTHSNRSVETVVVVVKYTELSIPLPLFFSFFALTTGIIYGRRVELFKNVLRFNWRLLQVVLLPPRFGCRIVVVQFLLIIGYQRIHIGAGDQQKKVNHKGWL